MCRLSLQTDCLLMKNEHAMIQSVNDYQDVSEWSAYFVFESNLSLNRQTQKQALQGDF